MVDFVPLEGDEKATRELELNLALSPVGSSNSQPNPVTNQKEATT